MQPSRNQIDSLTGLRGIAAGWVMLMHFREITPVRLWHFPIIDRVIANGAYGVDVFFVLSGFILSYIYAESFGVLRSNQVRRFLWYRFARIYPLHLVTFAVMMALFVANSVTHTVDHVPDRYSPLVILSSVTLTNAWIPGLQTPDMPAWSVSAEWFAYLIFPILCIFSFRRKFIFAIYFAVAMLLALTKPMGNFCLTHVLSGFLVGMVAYRLRPTLSRVGIGRWSGLIAATLIVVWSWQTTPSSAVGLLLFAALILALCEPTDLLSRALARPYLVLLGEISYSIYMVHWPVRTVVRDGLQRLGILHQMPSVLVVIVFVTVTVVVAALSYRYIELPARNVLRKAGTWRAERASSVAASSLD